MGLTNLEILYLNENQIKSFDRDMFNEIKELILLNLADNDLTILPKGLFMGLRNLKYLYLNGNWINSLEKELFNENNKLTYLNLAENSLFVLPKGLFTALENLEYLSLFANQINLFDKELFNETNKLTVLHLTDNNLTVLSNRLFMGMRNLEILSLRGNQINSLDGGLFNETDKLTMLDFRDNDLQVIPKGLFAGLTNLAYLRLSINQITLLDEALFDENNKLIELNLADNNLTVLPNGLFMGLTNLEILYLNENQIKSFDRDLFNELKELILLNLADNDLTILPKGLFMGLRNLKYLSLKGNWINLLEGGLFNETNGLFMGLTKIKSFDRDLFNELKELILLNLADNDLTFLPKGLFMGLRNLNCLFLGGNRINLLNGELFNENNKLTELYLRYNNLTVLPKGLFTGLGNLQQLSLSSNQINSFDKDLFNETSRLTLLHLFDNKLTNLPNGFLRGLKHLESLAVGLNQINSLHENLFNKTKGLTFLSFLQNNLVQLPNNLFRGLHNLQKLFLSDNKIFHMNENIFHDLINLKYLYLHNNLFKALNVDLFQHTRKISVLNLSGNKLPYIPDISTLHQLVYLNVKDNKLTGITYETFVNLPKETDLVVSQHEICECYVSDDVICTATGDRSPFLTCERLLSERVLVVVMWLIGSNAILGNIFVLYQKRSTSEKNKVQNFLLSNLAVSDLLMGVYMLLVASADIYFGKYFPMQAEAWRSGVTCRIAGTISILSSEASVFFVTLISIDRFICIKYPFSSRKLGKTSSVLIVSTVWVISLALGIVPSILAGKSDTFYDNSHVCIGLPLTKLQRYVNYQTEEWVPVCSDGDICHYVQPVQSHFVGEINGMIFASVMFLGVNFICYLLILVSYAEIVRAVFKSSQRAGLNREMKEQIRLTRKITVIVLTDFLCWFPIIILGILVQAGVLTLSASVFAWCVTFVLPINSAINPYLYTISAVISSRREQAATTNQQRNINQAESKL